MPNSTPMQDRLDVTPQEFEDLTADLLRRSGLRASDLAVETRPHIIGTDGVYEIDITARFEALGAEFLVLIECKHHHSPIKREVVQVLHDRMRSLGAQKGMLFSTAPFQSGAVEYARSHGIALIYVTPAAAVPVTREEFAERSSAEGWIPRMDGDDVSYLPFDEKPIEALLGNLNWRDA